MTDRLCIICGDPAGDLRPGTASSDVNVLPPKNVTCINAFCKDTRIRQLERELAGYTSGEYVPLPVSPAHATAMILIAENYLGTHPHE